MIPSIKTTLGIADRPISFKIEPEKISVSPLDVIREVPEAIEKVGEFVTETFIPGITDFFKTTGGIFGEGLAYLIDPVVRKQFEAGNTEILPYLTKTSVADIAKKTGGAMIETAVYAITPSTISRSVIKRFGIGAIQGVGFAISEGIAKNLSVKEVIDNAKIYGVAAAVLEIMAPWIGKLLTSRIKDLPKVLKRVPAEVIEEIRAPFIKQLGKEIVPEITKRVIKITTPSIKGILKRPPVAPKAIKEVITVKGGVATIDTPTITETIIKKGYDERQAGVFARNISSEAKVLIENNSLKIEVEIFINKSISDLKTISPVRITKATAVGKSIEAKSIEKGLTDSFSGVAEFTPITIKEQAKIMSDIMTSDIEKAKRIATGKEPLPRELKGATALKAMEDFAMETRDGKLALELANSPIAREISEAGQTLRLTAEREPSSATAKIKEILSERKRVSEKKLIGKDVKKIKSELKTSLQKKVREVKPKKHSWEALLNDLTC